jgi:hypothetical protein
MSLGKIVIKGKEIDLMKELGIDKLPLDVQEKVLERMTNIILRKSILKVVDSFSDKEAEEINKRLASGEINDIVKVLDEKVPDFDKILSEQIVLSQEEVLSDE